MFAKRGNYMAPKVKRVTIRDVARHAGTSPATVSRVLSEEGYPVGDELSARVRKAVEELEYEYTPQNRSASDGKGGALKKHTKTIGFVLPNISNPFYSQAITGVENVARQRGYQVMICNTLRDKARERRYLQMLLDMGIRHIILSSIDLKADNIREFSEKGMEFVLLEQQVDDDVNCYHINFDMYSGAVMAVDHLVKCGHRKIALATTPLIRWTRMQVYKGYVAALKAAGLQYDDRQVFISSSEHEVEEEGYDILAGRQLGQMIAERRDEFTAVLCVNDITSAGLIQGLNNAGVRIPEDLSLVSMDDIPFASVFRPELTTIRYPTYEGGKLAAMLLFDRMEGNSKYSLNLNIEPLLITRKSVKDIGV